MAWIVRYCVFLNYVKGYSYASFDLGHLMWSSFGRPIGAHASSCALLTGPP